MNTIIEILIDISGSMGTMKGRKEENKYLLPDGSTRISLAKRILLEEIVPTLDYSKKVFVRTFNAGHADKPIVTLIYEGPFNEDQIRAIIDSLPNDTSGGTPITAAVLASVENLKKEEYQNHERSIILVTDGEENIGDGDYTVAAENARTVEGIECKIYIIGILLAEIAESKAKTLAYNTGGAYLPFNEVQFNSADVRKALTPIKARIVEDSIKNISADNKATDPELLPKLKELEQKLDSIKNAKEYTLLIDQIDILKSKIAVLQSGQEKAISSILDGVEKKMALIKTSELEEKVSKKIDQVFSESEKGISSLSSQMSSLQTNILEKFGLIEYSKLNLIRRSESLESKLSEQDRLSKELVEKLTEQNDQLNKLFKKQQNRTYITWFLITLGIIVTLAAFYIMKYT